MPVEGLEADDVDFAAVETASSLSDKDECELLPPQTMVYGAQSQRRHWSGEGKDQAMQLHDKHLTALREVGSKSPWWPSSYFLLAHGFFLLPTALPKSLQSENCPALG